MKRKIAAIVAADVAGYSRLVAEDEEETLRRLSAYREVFDDFIRRYGGRIFNTAGDAVLSEFESAVEAVRAAIDIQESLRTRNMAYPPSRKLQFRIGITIGDVVERGGDLLGDGVNIAARLEGLAEPGGICVSRSVHEAVANKISVPFRDLGTREVKNIPNPVHAFVVALPNAEAAAASPEPKEAPKRRVATWLIGSGTAALIAAGLGAVWLMPRSAEPPGMSGTAPGQQAAAPPQAVAPVPPPTPTATAQSAPPALPADPVEALAQLARQGGLVADPKSPPELYHNARVLEARGEAPAARRAYHQLAVQGSERIDPLLRYAALLRAQEGRAGARETFSELAAQTPGRAVSLVHALQFDGAERRAKVAAFAAAHPDYPPAQYLLAEEHGEDRIGAAQTLRDRRAEQTALRAFLRADTEGRLNPFFLDQSVLSSWLDKARRRSQALDAYFATASTQPSIQLTRSNSGWMVTVMPPEAATSLSYLVGETGVFRSTGTSPTLDQRTGKPFPQMYFELPPDQPPTVIHLRYEDADGVPSAVSSHAFEPRAALAKTLRATLDMTQNAWLAFRPDWDTLLYYTHLVSYRCAIAQAVIGFDDGPMDKALPIPPCDVREPYAIPSHLKPYVTIPKSTRSVSLQLTYADGSQSEVKTFRR
ncbi:MAG TPA: adenylate/guanylate cyclase domain-containing protein [Beijerinckiaceae bacterium]|jgi:class 3 adenylate cyclase